MTLHRVSFISPLFYRLITLEFLLSNLQYEAHPPRVGHHQKSEHSHIKSISSACLLITYAQVFHFSPEFVSYSFHGNWMHILKQKIGACSVISITSQTSDCHNQLRSCSTFIKKTKDSIAGVFRSFRCFYMILIHIPAFIRDVD